MIWGMEIKFLGDLIYETMEKRFMNRGHDMRFKKDVLIVLVAIAASLMAGFSVMPDRILSGWTPGRLNHPDGPEPYFPMMTI